jgi:hypothetical protein
MAAEQRAGIVAFLRPWPVGGDTDGGATSGDTTAGCVMNTDELVVARDARTIRTA